MFWESKLKFCLNELFISHLDKIWIQHSLLLPGEICWCLCLFFYSTELSVTHNLVRVQRSVCAQLRCVILPLLPLTLETGRFHSVPEENRKCSLCDLGEVGNEMPFLFYRPLYHALRYQLLGRLSENCTELFFHVKMGLVPACLIYVTYISSAKNTFCYIY